jgi:hypothetical protein
MIESEALAASAAPFGWAAHGTEGAADKKTMVSMTGRAGRVGPRGAPVRRPREKSRGRSDENERIADIIKGPYVSIQAVITDDRVWRIACM